MEIFNKLFGRKKKETKTIYTSEMGIGKKCAICGCSVLDGKYSQFLSQASEGEFVPILALTRTQRLICENCGAVICTGCATDWIGNPCPKCGSKMRVISVL